MFQVMSFDVTKKHPHIFADAFFAPVRKIASARLSCPPYYDGTCTISRGFEPFAGPTMPRSSISSIRRAARL